jgi:hypothetical protein
LAKTSVHLPPYPGKRPLVTLVGAYLAVLCGIVPILAVMISVASLIWFLFPIYLLNFGGIWFWAHRMRRDGWGEGKLIFEDSTSLVTDIGVRDITYSGSTAQRKATADADVRWKSLPGPTT